MTKCCFFKHTVKQCLVSIISQIQKWEQLGKQTIFKCSLKKASCVERFQEKNSKAPRIEWSSCSYVPSPLPVSRVLRNHMCCQMANGRTALHWFHIWNGGKPLACDVTAVFMGLLWLIHMWQQRQGRPAQQRNLQLSSKSPKFRFGG